MFDLYFIPSLLLLTNLCLYIILFFSMQRLPNCAITHVNASGQHMTILRRFGPPLQWNVVVVDLGVGRKYVVQPWYQFLADNDFSHGDEVSFYYRSIDKIWEIVIRRRKSWDYQIQFVLSFFYHSVFYKHFVNCMVSFLLTYLTLNIRYIINV